MKPIHRRMLALSACILIPLSQASADSRHSDSLVTEFVDGGDITIKLSAGLHQIETSPDNNIRISWKVHYTEDLDDVDAETSVNGSHANIELNGPRKKFRTVIEVPENSDLTVRVSAGELHVEDVGGDRDIKLRAGDLNIEVDDSNKYGHVEGSLWAGDIDAGPFKIGKSGLFRSIEWHGEGEQDLRFKLYAGDVDLSRGSD